MEIQGFLPSCFQLPGFPGGSAGKESACSAGALGLIPGLGRSPGEGKGYPLQYSSLESSMNCIVHGVTESDTTEQLSASGAGLLPAIFLLFGPSVFYLGALQVAAKTPPSPALGFRPLPRAIPPPPRPPTPGSWSRTQMPLGPLRPVRAPCSLCSRSRFRTSLIQPGPAPVSGDSLPPASRCRQPD